MNYQYQDGTTWTCNTCASQGYPNYLRNDPIYKNMELWSSTSSLQSRSTKQACGTCRDNVCALLPPSGSGFPCYEGTPDNAATCYKTDPLLKVSTFIIFYQ
jgi:hypothetical protein